MIRHLLTHSAACAALAFTFASGSASAIGLNDVLNATQNATQKQGNTNQQEGASGVMGAVNQLGRGQTGQMQSNAMVNLVCQQLGIPETYQPAVQSLYTNFMGDGNVTESEVQSESAFAGWIDDQQGFTTESVAMLLQQTFTAMSGVGTTQR